MDVSWNGGNAPEDRRCTCQPGPRGGGSRPVPHWPSANNDVYVNVNYATFRPRVVFSTLASSDRASFSCSRISSRLACRSAIFETRGNNDCHVILRGGKQPNYAAPSVDAACQLLQAAGLRGQVMVDVSHANSSKQHSRQIDVAADVAGQVAGGDRRIVGLMIESHLQEGRQDIVAGQPLAQGVSVTDACISMAQTVPVLQALAQAVRERRQAR